MRSAGCQVDRRRGGGDEDVQKALQAVRRGRPFGGEQAGARQVVEIDGRERGLGRGDEGQTDESPFERSRVRDGGACREAGEKGAQGSCPESVDQ